MSEVPVKQQWGSVWIWLLAFQPAAVGLDIVVLHTSDFVRTLILEPQNVSSSPGYIFTFALVPIVGIVSVLFAALDYRSLIVRGFVRPFHWAWALLFTPIYVIGRSAVVIRRSKTGKAPLFTFIYMAVSSIGLVVAWVALWTVLVVMGYPNG
jgi:hypothetical protein